MKKFTYRDDAADKKRQATIPVSFFIIPTFKLFAGTGIGWLPPRKDSS